jgi:hypothetical protein
MVYKGCDCITNIAEIEFHCPLLVRPLVYFFFSPSVYYREIGYDVGCGIESGLMKE